MQQTRSAIFVLRCWYKVGNLFNALASVTTESRHRPSRSGNPTTQARSYPNDYFTPPPVCVRVFSNKGEVERGELSPTSVAHLSQNILLPLLLQEAQHAADEFCPTSQVHYNLDKIGSMLYCAVQHLTGVDILLWLLIMSETLECFIACLNAPHSSMVFIW